MRINKFLADAGICSRRKADQHISSGDVHVNDKPAQLGMTVDPETDRVTFCGKPVSPKLEELVYYALYKPPGVVSTVSDPHGRPTVTDLVPDSPRLYPVGRLDLHSEGLVLLTNDGELAHQLMHPRFEHKKEYEVVVRWRPDGPSAQQVIRQFTEGVEIDGKLMQADQISIAANSDQTENIATLRIVLHTGYNRQIRRMCGALDLSVIALRRIRISKLRLKELDLKPGQYRQITKGDIV
jgi:23S rRNA pseudouridine2605 synthase